MTARSAIIFLIVLTLVCYVALLGGGFQFLASWDDHANIVDNPLVNSGSLEIWWRAWTAEVLGVYEPLALILKAMIVRTFGLEVRAFQLVTLGLHILNSCLLFLLARKLLFLAQSDSMADLRPGLGAFLAALLFALHPMRVEVVAWASAQPYALACTFFLLSLLSYLGYWERKSRRGDDPIAPALLALSIVAYLAAICSKSAAIFLPVVLLLVDFFPLRRRLEPRALLEKTPYFIAGLALGWTAMRATAEDQTLIVNPLDLPARLATAANSMLFHLGKTLWPASLQPHYALVRRDVSPFSDSMLLYTTAFFAICVVALLAWRAAPWLTTAWFTYVAGILPVSGILGHGHAILGADRYTYLPLTGLWIAAAAVLTSRRVVPSLRPESPRARLWLGGLVLVFLVWGVSTQRQVQHWKDDESLWRNAIDLDPANALALSNLGYFEIQRKNFDEATPLLVKALILEPTNLRAALNLGISYQKVGRHGEAVRVYNRALAHHPGEASLHNNLAIAHAQLSHRRKANEHKKKARRPEPRTPSTLPPEAPASR
jgi:tetratricopeptide (TPR) repeat protein